MKNKPFVSIVIPCLNEEEFIAKSLHSIIAQDYPKEKMEILVVDGMSEDMTRKIVEFYVNNNSLIKLLDNPKRITTCAFNIGIKYSKGEIIVIMGAHALYKNDYISKCIKYLNEYEADNVGGRMITLPWENTLIANAIVQSLSTRFGVGNSYFRTGSKESKWVDTVFGGCYKREVFDKIGLFDEDLVKNQDDEFNLRLIRNGGKILLVPDIVTYYYSRNSLPKLWNQHFQYGYFKPLVLKKIGALLTFRQIVPPLFVLSLIVSGMASFFSNYFFIIFLFISGLYISANILFSLIISIKNDIKLFPFLIISFFTLHFSYGFGYIKGLWDFFVLKKHAKHMKDITLSR